ncbi:MAG: hypothetical protein AAF664_23290, partial [Planctomycetota bacterium]
MSTATAPTDSSSFPTMRPSAFGLDPRLARIMRQVTWRVRWTRGIAFFACWLFATAVFGWWWIHQIAVEIPTTSVITTLLVIAASGVVVSAIAAAGTSRSQLDVARKIEAKYPDLKQGLLASLENSNAHDPMLRERMQMRLRAHANKNAWDDVIPTWKLVLLWMFMLIAATGFLATVARAVTWNDDPTRSLAAAIRLGSDRFSVEPGDIELPRGEPLLVTVTIPTEIMESGPPNATLELTVGPSVTALDADAEAKNQGEVFSSLQMRRLLDDPFLTGGVDSLEQSINYKVIVGAWESPVYSVEVFDYPKLEQIDALVQYPDYLQRDDREVKDTFRVSAPVRSEVEWSVRVNKPLSTVTFLDDSVGESIELKNSESDEFLWVGQQEVLRNRKYQVNLIDAQGRTNTRTSFVTVKAIQNQAIEFESTTGLDREVTPLEEWIAGVRISDDQVIVEAGLEYSIEGEPAEVLTLVERDSEGSKPRSTIELQQLISMEELDAKADQLLTYHWWAKDFGDDGEPRTHRGDIQFVTVRPFEKSYSAAEPPPGQQQNQPQSANEAMELAELQKEIISATFNLQKIIESELKPSDHTEDVQTIIESQSQAVVQLDDLAQKLTDDYSRQTAESIRESMNQAIEVLSRAKNSSSQPTRVVLSEAIGHQRAAYSGLLRLRAREIQVTRARSQSASRAGRQQNRDRQLQQLKMQQDENRYETQSTATETQEEQEAAQARQLMARLKELARRQAEIQRQIAETQAAIEAAETPEEEQEAQQRLERLRDQQREMLRDIDEASESMSSSQSSQSSDSQSSTSSSQSESSPQERLQQAREQVRKAAEAMEDEDTAGAMAEGKRAQETLEQLRDEFREQSGAGLNQEVRKLEEDAEKLRKSQQEIERAIGPEESVSDGPGLRPDAQEQDQDLEQLVDDQMQRLEELRESIRQTVERAEETEPVLAERLFEAFQAIDEKQIADRLRQAKQLDRLGFEPQAQRASELATEGVEDVSQKIDGAAEAILGSRERAMQRALEQLRGL